MNRFFGFLVPCFGLIVQISLCQTLKKESMRTSNTFGVHFILRMNKEKHGSAPVYARIVVNGSRIEMALKKSLKVGDWNPSKGFAKPKNDSLKILNSYLEQVRGVLSGYYQELVIAKKLITPEVIKN